MDQRRNQSARGRGADSAQGPQLQWGPTSDQASAVPPGPASMRGAAEAAFGSAIADVRIHTDAAAASRADAVGARAVTVGRDVYFAAGEYSPGTREGDRLLAHELTHVAQGPVQGQQAKQRNLSTPDQAAEREADRVADQLVSNVHEGANHAVEVREAPEATFMRKAKSQSASQTAAVDEAEMIAQEALGTFQYSPGDFAAKTAKAGGVSKEVESFNADYPQFQTMNLYYTGARERVNSLATSTGLDPSAPASYSKWFAEAGAKVKKDPNAQREVSRLLGHASAEATVATRSKQISKAMKLISSAEQRLRQVYLQIEKAEKEAELQGAKDKLMALQSEKEKLREAIRYVGSIAAMVVRGDFVGVVEKIGTDVSAMVKEEYEKALTMMKEKVADAVGEAINPELAGKIKDTTAQIKQLEADLLANGQAAVSAQLHAAQTDLGAAGDELEVCLGTLRAHVQNQRTAYAQVGAELDAQKTDNKALGKSPVALSEGRATQMLMMVEAIRERVAFGKQVYALIKGSKGLKVSGKIALKMDEVIYGGSKAVDTWTGKTVPHISGLGPNGPIYSTEPTKYYHDDNTDQLIECARTVWVVDTELSNNLSQWEKDEKLWIKNLEALTTMGEGGGGVQSI